jgi:predicted O-methyltransferase YrrM
VETLARKKKQMKKDRNDLKEFDLNEYVNENWKYHNPVFEYEETLNDTGWPWAGHKYFAYDLIANLKPKRVVELGTHRGTSLFAFCQAAKDHLLETEIVAVDAWKGDEQAGFYDENVFQEVNEIKDNYYSRINVKLLRKTFDEAANEFEEDSIDILHIDGLHTYEAVKHDFENWCPKINDSGIIIFHDIEVGENDFGVYKLWENLKEKFSTIEFYHSFGLGVLFINKEIGKDLLKYQKKWQMHYSYIHEIRKYQGILQKEKEIESMKSSKFWKLRNIYVKLRRYFFWNRK